MSAAGDPELAARAADAAARRLAQREFERPLLLEAGAGTGKTSVLVTRVLAWCLGPGWERAAVAVAKEAEGADAERIAGRILERVVAVTFTEAAAAEMEDRIARGLHALVAEGAAWPIGLAPDAVPEDPAARRARAQALLTSFDRLRVSTIHAFCRRLLAEHPVEAGVHPRFTVDAAGLARAGAAREAVESWLFDPRRADDPDLFALVEAGVAAPDLEAMVDALLASAIPPERFAEDPLAAPRIAALAARLRAAAEAFLEAEGGLLRRAKRPTNGARVAAAVEATLALLAVPPADPAGLAELVAALGAHWPGPLCARLAGYAR
ncbi:MAG TPA: UvrD-helicase domain-containing protein, partial [Myxococcota bacterium]|nr:UvrD-helicase domain-containing protein [Myxococcota bacterium]